jgi:hypothetical protein
MPQLSSVSVLWDPATGPMQKKGVEIVDKEFKLEIIEVPGLPNLRNPHARAAARAIPRN